MSRIDFDSEVPRIRERRRGFNLEALAPPLVVLIIGVVGLFAYKIYLENFREPVNASNSAEVAQLRLQLADAQKRLDQYERRHRTAQSDSATASTTQPEIAAKSVPATKSGYQVMSASKLPAVSQTPPAPTVAFANQNHPAVQNNDGGQHDAMNAAVPKQEVTVQSDGRRAISFQLRTANSRTAVGPIALQLESTDAKNQRYTICIYADGRCLDLNEHAANEVVVFTLPRNGARLEVVATKVARDQVSGYVMVPADN